MKIDGTKVLILGATSAVAREFARLAVARHCSVALVARNAAHLEATAADLRVRGASPVSIEADLSRVEDHRGVLDRSWAGLGGVDFALIAYGAYAERDEAEDTETLVRLLETNFVTAAHLAVRIAERFEAHGSGCLAAITSVAGDRARRRNYVYAAGKRGLSTLIQGLDHKLGRGPVRIVDIRMGVVDTPMTVHLPSSPLKASARDAAAAILAGMESGRAVVYAPWFWRWISGAVRAVPRKLMNRLDI